RLPRGCRRHTADHRCQSAFRWGIPVLPSRRGGSAGAHGSIIGRAGPRSELAELPNRHQVSPARGILDPRQRPDVVPDGARAAAVAIVCARTAGVLTGSTRLAATSAGSADLE